MDRANASSGPVPYNLDAVRIGSGNVYAGPPGRGWTVQVDSVVQVVVGQAEVTELWLRTRA